MLPLLFSAGKRRRYYQRLLAFRRSNLVCFWPMWEPSGTTARDISGNGLTGTYSGVTLGAAGLDNKICPSFDGINDNVDIASASLSTLFGRTEGTMMLWGRASAAGVWTDTKFRGLFGIYQSASNYVLFMKTNLTRQILMRYKANGVDSDYSLTFPTATTDWFHLAMTWSKSGDVVNYYVDGVIKTPKNGLGAWPNAALSATGCVIGATSTADVDVWSGRLQYAAVWSVALTSAEIARLAVIR